MLSIDLTRMECKVFIVIQRYINSSSIDLTRMECKDMIEGERKIAYFCIDLTRMECKGLKPLRLNVNKAYRFNQNGM